jgi:flagellar biosynthesis protein FlhF
MNLQTFSAATMVEALAQVKQTMGHDAVILHTRTFSRRYWLGIRRREIVEITAGRGLQVPERRRRTMRGPGPQAMGPQNLGLQGQANQYLQASTNQRRAVSGYQASLATMGAALVAPMGAPAPAAVMPAVSVATAREQFLQTPAAGNAAILGLSQEVTGLKSMVKDLVTVVRQKQSPQVPEELFDHYMQLIDNQVAEEIATELIKTVREQLRPEQLTQPGMVNAKIAELLERLIPIAGPILRTKTSGPHVVALIGPTGVGKTTTLAKLAANLKLREQKRVGLITLDTFRIAAIDQLGKYAEILRCEIRAVNSPDELRKAIAAMSDNDYILIDTAGRSPKDTMKLNELKCFLEAAGPNGPDEVHLVLSSTVSQPCVDLAIARFSEVRCDKIIFTKLDEAAHVGVILNVVRKVNKSLSYVTTGQEVPNDIEVGKGRELARRILGTDAFGQIALGQGSMGKEML